MLDGTPIYDIKPYLPFSDSHPDAKAGYADTVLDHTVNVSYRCNTDSLTAQELSVLTQILREDPKPSYQNDASRIYKMNFSHYSVSFTTDKINLYVNEIKEQ